MKSKITYRQQFTRCGKQRCRKCREGAGHGPYWYAYWSENGRTISKYIGVNPPAEARVEGQRTIETTEDTGSPAPGTPHISQPVLRIYALGQFRLERRVGNEWHTVDSRTWQSRRARALLGRLLSNPGRRLGREQVMEALWPELDMERAANRLNGAVHELRRLLEPELARPADSRLLRLKRDVLELADSTQILVDADNFENLLAEANATASPEQVERILEEAAALYSGDYLLEELYSEWAAPRREALRRGWMGLLLKLAELREAQGALIKAIEPLDRLLVADPTNETAVRRLMLILIQLDRRGEALRAYQRLVTALQKEYESDPLPETQELYEAIRQGRISASRSLTPQVSTTENNSPPRVETAHPKTQAQELSFSRPVFQLSRYNQSPLIGRNRELEIMRQHLLTIEQGRELQIAPTQGMQFSAPEGTRPSHFLLLMGEAGIGKTRLAEELSQEANIRGWAVAWSRTYEQEGTIPYRPWTELLRAFFPSPGTLSLVDPNSHSKLERLSVLLPELLVTAHNPSPQTRSSSPPPPEQERLHLWEATLWLLNTLSQATPLLLVLDDLHWTDDSSLELLAYLARHLQDQRVLLVGTCRDMELAPSHGLRNLISDLRRERAIVTLAVPPLTASQIGSLVAHLPENIVQSIQSQASGNPFFAEELARELQTTDDGEIDEEKLSPLQKAKIEIYNTLPETIAAVLDRRLNKLSSECQTLLGKAAMLGGSFELSQLLFMASDGGGSFTATANEDAILDLLEEALHAGLLTEEGTGARISYHFWHPLIVSHLYERPSAARRAQLHRRAANALLHLHKGRETEVAAALTHHLSKGGSDPAQLAHYAEMAGNQAYAVAAYSEAQHYYRQAIQALSNAKIQLTDGHTPLIFSDLSSESFDLLHLARLLERVCECMMVQGNFEEARQLYECILELRNQQSRPGNEESLLVNRCQQEAQVQALIWREIGRTWTETGEYAQAHKCYERGKQVLADAGVTSGAAWAGLHLQQGIMRWLEGNFEAARRYGQEALEILERVMQNLQRSNQSQILDMRTRVEQVILGDPLELGRAHESLGVIAASFGQPAESLKHLHTALGIYEEHGLVMAMAKVCGNLAAVYIGKSENTVARAYLHRSLELTERMGDVPNMAFVTGNLGDMALRSGDLVEAEKWLRHSLALSERVNDREHTSWCTVVLATALQNQGDLREASASIHRALTVSRVLKSTRCLGFALIAVGDLRVAQAIAACKLEASDSNENALTNGESCSTHVHKSFRFLLRARTTLQKALALEGLEAEVMIEGQLVLASVYFLLGEIEAAQEKAMRTLEEARQQELVRVEARSQRLLARILAAQGEREQADQYFEQSIQVFREHGMRLDYARALHGYGVTLLTRSVPGDQLYQQGLAYLHEALDICINCYASIDQGWIERILSRYEQNLISNTDAEQGDRKGSPLPNRDSFQQPIVPG